MASSSTSTSTKLESCSKSITIDSDRLAARYEALREVHARRLASLPGT
jgi:hypothetical protein